MTTLARLRRGWPILVVLALAGCGARAGAQSFEDFVAALRADAMAQGIRPATFAQAMDGLTPDPAVLVAMAREPEYGKPMGAYLEGLDSPARLATGTRKYAQWATTLQAVKQRFGVDPAMLVAIWGIESSFGGARDPWDVFRSLATLAYAQFQPPLFHDQLLDALRILQDDHIPRRQFLGSWAGAMGQAQFLPSSYLAYAVDFDGDGHPDIWTSVPDVLASIANYLQKAGWRADLPWGVEVRVPQGFDYSASRASFAAWAGRGFRRADGTALPDAPDPAILFFPSGASGPAFLVTGNFDVIKRYNNSDAYALAAGLFSDRLRGLGPIRAPWPPDDFQPSRGQRVALQSRLAALGFTVDDRNGHIDFALRDAIRQMQQRFGMVADGYPGRAFLQRVGVAAP